jgi:hypothetical protein
VAAHLLIVVGIVFGINLLPAFGPPTWAVLVYFRFRHGDIPVPVLIICGALAAAAGRVLLSRSALSAPGSPPSAARASNCSAARSAKAAAD